MENMPDQGKVIKDLEYATTDEDMLDMIYPRFAQIMRDALELLKAQVPRLLTLEEALEADVCWAEINGMDRVPPCRIGKNLEGYFLKLFVGCPEVFQEDEYGREIRCWSARPTDEQLATKPWEPPKEG